MSDQNLIVNPLPWSVLVLSALLLLPEVYFFGSEVGLWGVANIRILLISQIAVIPEVFEFATQTGHYSFDLALRFFAFSFVHAQALGTLMAMVLTLALGKFLAENLGNFAVLFLYFAAALIGAIFYCFVSYVNYPLYGGFTGVYGLLGAFTFILFSRAGPMLRAQIMAFSLIGFVLALNLLVTLMYGGPPTWVAEIGAALFGFCAAALLRPSGLSIILARLRRD